MIDTIKIFLRLDKPICEDKFQKITVVINKKTGEFLHNWTKFRNLYLQYTDDYLILEGSLAKHYFGNNLQTLSRDDIQKAIELISSDLKTQISLAEIWRLDFGKNIVVENLVCEYLDCLINLSRYKKSYDRGTLYFRNGGKTICLYDKLQEMKDKNAKILEEYKGKNILRLELRIFRKVKNEFKLKKIQLGDLYNGRIYNLMFERLNYYYERIYKVKKIIHRPKNIKSFQNLKEFLLLKNLIDNGMDTAFNEIESISVKNNKSKNSKWKKDLKELMDNSKFIQPNELIEELDRKIMGTKEMYL